MLDPIIEPDELLVEMTLFCRAYPLARPRLNKNKGVYQPLTNQQQMRSLMEPYSSDFPIKRPFWLTINAFYAVGSYNNTPYVSSFDVDNVAKAVADNMQAMKIIADDKWMVGLSVTKQLSAEDYTIIRIYGVEDNGYYAAPLSGRSNK